MSYAAMLCMEADAREAAMERMQDEEERRGVVALPCVRCGTVVQVPAADYEEDPSGMVTCDTCWPVMQAEMWAGVEQSPVYDDSIPY